MTWLLHEAVRCCGHTGQHGRCAPSATTFGLAQLGATQRQQLEDRRKTRRPVCRNHNAHSDKCFAYHDVRGDLDSLPMACHIYARLYALPTDRL